MTNLRQVSKCYGQISLLQSMRWAITC